MSIKKTLTVTLVTAYITSYDVTCNVALGADRFSRAENVDVVKFSPGTLFVSIELRDLTNLYLLRLKQSR